MNDIILDTENKHRAMMCIANIKDKLRAVEMELEKDNSYKSYMKEKTNSILWDANVLNSMMDNN